ncbi:MAG TPA: aminotransferase class I/II-fold pyridoxal phosphate-dependent enzyme [Acidimicrobiales bacterium]|nr:aminotransferase class I/II-fold pyridoxal phosphate-dependent enzyme [Acidimicrobiales bacterium]
MSGSSSRRRTGFSPPPYPHDRLTELAEVAAAHSGGMVDLSVGTPCDPPPRAVVDALASSGAERGYPASAGSARLKDAVIGWLARRFAVTVDRDQVAACVGTKEFVASVAWYLRLRSPDRDTVLAPAIAYPTYALGAELAGCRTVLVPTGPDGTMDFGALSRDDAARAVVLWVNSPANPTGVIIDLEAAASFGRAFGIPVISDECYAEFSWSRWPPATVLGSGTDGVVALHSLSKRSNLAGLRIGCYAGDAALVGYLSEVRKHAGLMAAGPVQAAAAVAWEDDEHVERQRTRYRRRLERLAAVLRDAGLLVDLPDGGFYLWVPAPASASGDGPAEGGPGGAWALAGALAEIAGVLVSPGDFYGPAGAGHVRIAVVQPDDRLELVARRLATTLRPLSAPGSGAVPGTGAHRR